MGTFIIHDLGALVIGSVSPRLLLQVCINSSLLCYLEDR